MSSTLTKRDYRIIGIVIVVALVSLAVTIKYFWKAFPEASIEFKVSRDESRQIAEKFLAGRGFQAEAYRHSSVFDFNETSKLYLERTLGLERMNELAGPDGKIRIWRWSHRWFKPLEKEELRVEITPSGEVAGFDHELPETAPGANLGPPAARAIAEDFLSKTLGRDLSQLEFLEAAEEKRPSRTDHVLTWKDRSVDLGDGSHRLDVTVAGDQPSGYREYVHIPEDWMRQYQELRSRNETAQIIDEVFWILLSVAMLVALVQRLRIHDAPVRLSLKFGAVATVLVFLDALNTFSLAQYNYSTADTYSGFVATYFLQSVLTAFGAGIGIFLIVAASEPIYRESFPQLASIGRTLSWSGLRSRSFFMANVVGIGLTFFFFAYQTVFYLAANKLGAWAPSDVPFSDQLNTTIPWVAVLFGGFAPAVLEEMQFRAFALPFLRKLVRYWPAAIVLAAFNWGFLHAAYPNQPFFIRGVEVGVGGIVIGIVMLRFGVISTLIWHYSIDALYTAFILLRSSNFYLKFSGALAGGIMLIPLGVALIAYWRTGAFSDESSISNSADQPPQRAIESEPIREPAASVIYTPFSSRRLTVAVLLIVVFGALAVAPIYRFGEDVKLRVTRQNAVAAASEFLKGRNVNAQNYRSVAWLDENVDPSALKYLLEHESVRGAADIYKSATRLLLWNVRYFRSAEKEEHSVFVDASTGQVFGYRHVLDEDAPGASLPVDAARNLAEKAAADNGYDLQGFELVTSQEQKRKARQDHTFVWQAKPGDPRNVGDARYRIEADVAGDDVVGFRRFFKLPEDWLRNRSSSGIGNAALAAVLILAIGTVLAGFVILFVSAVRSGAVQWNASAKVGVMAGVAALIAAAGQLATVDRMYDTSIPLATFHGIQFVGLFVSSLFVGLMVWVTMALCSSLYPQVWSIFNSLARMKWRRDATIALVLMLLGITAAGQINGLLMTWLHGVAPAEADIVPPLFDAYAPGLTIFLQGIVYAILFASASGTVVYMAQNGWRSRAWWFWGVVALMVIALGPVGARSASEYFGGWLMRFIPASITLLIVIAFFRDNVLAYVSAAVSLLVFNSLTALIREPNAFFRWNGVLLLALLLAVLAWLLVPFVRRRTSSSVYDGGDGVDFR